MLSVRYLLDPRVKRSGRQEVGGEDKQGWALKVMGTWIIFTVRER